MIRIQEIALWGLNHRVAPVEIREKLAYKPSEILEVLPLLKGQAGIDEAVILSTCNRTEIYVVTGMSQEKLQLTLQTFFQKNKEIVALPDGYYKAEADAVRHLFKVAAGLDSMMLGEPQILGQVKDAYHLAVQAATIPSLLDRLFNFSFVVGKKVRTDTDLGEGAISIAHAAVELAQKIFQNLYEHKALLIGAGEMSELVASHMQEKGVAQLFIANRTLEKAQRLADRFNAQAIPFNEIQAKLAEVDIVIGATSSPDYLLTQKNMQPVVAKRSAQPLFLIDISVPRNFDPAINQLDNVFVNDIDALEQIVEQNLAKRRQEVPKAEKIIEAEILQFFKWRNSLEIGPIIVALREKMEKICEAELQKHQNSLGEKEFQKASTIARNIVNKILHMPTMRLKEYDHTTTGGTVRLDVVRELFDLPEPGAIGPETGKK